MFADDRFGFALVEATPPRMEIRFFGYGRGDDNGESYCRILELTGETVVSSSC